jgi:hypothetical protein
MQASASSLFELTHTASAAFYRHHQAVDQADAKQRKAARESVLDHLADIMLAHQFEIERQASNQRNQIEHDNRIKAERIATLKAAFKGAKVNTLPQSIAFFTDVLRGAVVALDAAGKIGTRAAEMRSDAATTAIMQSGRKDYHVQLPSGIIAVRVTDPALWVKMTETWTIPPTLAWTIAGSHYALFSGTITRAADCGAISFLPSCRCGSSAEWIIEPSEVELDAEGKLPSLPDAVAEAINSCAAGAEKLLFSFLTR